MRGTVTGLLLASFFVVLLLSVTIFINLKLGNQLKKIEDQQVYHWTLALAGLEHPARIEELQFSVIRSNTYIPAIVQDASGNIVSARNIDDKILLDSAMLSGWLGKQVRAGRVLELNFPDQAPLFIYYDNSRLVKTLNLLPWVQAGLIIALVLLVFLTVKAYRQYQEQTILSALVLELSNQLRVPLSSLWAWFELLRESQSLPPRVIHELEHDLNRTEEVLRRFSHFKELKFVQQIRVSEVLRKVLKYLRSRLSARLKFKVRSQGKILVVGDPVLIAWAIENAILQAAHRLNEDGNIQIHIKRDKKWGIIEITDDGPPVVRTGLLLGKRINCSRVKDLLRLMKWIVSRIHKGKVEFSTSPEGNILRIYLPIFSYDKAKI